MSEDHTFECASPEMRFLLACIRTQAEGVAADNLAADLDWDTVITLCRAHRCIPLVHRHLQKQKASGSSTVPPEVMASLKMLAIKIAVCNVGMTEALCSIQTLLRKHEIQVTCIKGPALAWLAYADTSMRQFGDLDLIVSRKDMARTVDLLMRHGYELRGLKSRTSLRAFLPTLEDVTFQNEDRTTYLDLSSVVISHVLSRPALADHILRESHAISIDERRYLCSPGPELMMMVVCMHGTEDMWNKLFAVADVAALLQSHPAADWAGMLETAADWGQKRSILVGMATARQLLNVTLPAEISHAIASDAVSVRLAGEAVHGIVSQNSLTASWWHPKRFEFRSRERVRDRLRWLIRLIFVPSSKEFNAVALPHSLAFLYYVIKPLRLLMTLTHHPK